jgi:Cu/Zn superoxide dismutase
MNKWMCVLLVIALAACAPAATSSRTVALVTTDALGAASKAQGRVELVTQGDGATRVVITMTGLTAGAKHAAHIHIGSCQNQGAVAVPLTDLSVDADGAGFSSTVIETGRIPVAAYVNVHQRGSADAAGPGGGVACANIR